MNNRIVAAAFAASAPCASAGDFPNIRTVAQDEFRGLSRDLGAAGGVVVRTWSCVSGSPLQEERQNQGRYFAGLGFNLLAMNLAVEAERAADNTSLPAKLGLRF